MKTTVCSRRGLNSFVLLLIVLFVLPSGLCFSQEPEINWIPGPNVCDLGDNVASIELAESYVFANSDDTKEIMQLMGNPKSNREVGLIMPKDQDANWYIVFEYFPVGYIKDDEKDSIDSDAILESIKEGNQKANERRKELGFSPLSILGWYEKPHYDDKSHNLVWAVLADSDGKEIVNYDTRLLGRSGYISAVLVADKDTLDPLKPQVENILSKISYNKGKSYAEYVQGDKLAKYGLTALIAGGAGAAAVKLGFFKMLAKAWKLVVAGAVAFIAFLGKIIKTIFGRKTTEITYDPESN